MAEVEATQAVRFGRTVVRPVTGDLVDQPVQAIVYAANSRGVMGAGPAGAVRQAGGPEIEREAMAAAPFDLGTAIMTGSGRLAGRGLEAVIHAVVAPHLGDATELPEVRRALAAALRAADTRRFRSLAIPLLGSRSEATAAERAVTVEAIVEELVAHLRRADSRLESVLIVSRFDDDLAMIVDSLTRARQRSWTDLA
ncbi:MAG: O-acetyl-ADP-ribose deacetylase [Thermomicrobiales bacterium]|jgi:O-acetyl-ADP-ribose deacetylase (regulator of RNase III)|nr:O-acetyl-ADP-ribose deacetylase [Thermomicrobiales bacterium]MEA2526017.1 O-acetyl-ADP-ribose deacetylase [Thermomicrobiales bacterium]